MHDQHGEGLFTVRSQASFFFIHDICTVIFGWIIFWLADQKIIVTVLILTTYLCGFFSIVVLLTK